MRARAKFRSRAFKNDIEGQGREGRGSEVRRQLTLPTVVVGSRKAARGAGVRDEAQREEEEDKKREGEVRGRRGG